MKSILFLMVCLAACLIAPGYSQEETQTKTIAVEGSKQEPIDIRQKEAGSFLDTDVQSFFKQANQAYESKNYEDAARNYLDALHYDISNALALYNLACCYGLLNEPELAAWYLEKAAKAGFTNLDHIKGDGDFDQIRNHPAFIAVIDKLAELMKNKQAEEGELVYVQSKIMLPCSIRTPIGFDPHKKYRLVVGLHGWGNNPDNFLKLWQKFGQSDFIYAVPQAPFPINEGKEIGFSWSAPDPTKNKPHEFSWAQSEDYVCEVIQSLRKKYQITETYLLGFSQGAGLAYPIGIKNTKLIKGIIVFGGWLENDALPAKTIKAGQKLRVFIAHGKQDQVVDYQLSLKAKEALQASGYEVSYHDFDGGHTIPESVLQLSISWLQNYTKQAGVPSTGKPSQP